MSLATKSCDAWMPNLRNVGGSTNEIDRLARQLAELAPGVRTRDPVEK